MRSSSWLDAAMPAAALKSLRQKHGRHSVCWVNDHDPRRDLFETRIDEKPHWAPEINHPDVYANPGRGKQLFFPFF